MNLFPVLKVNIDAVLSIKALLTVAVVYPWFPVPFQIAQVTASLFLVRIFCGNARMGWKRSLNQRFVLGCFSWKWFCLCNKQSTADTILVLLTSLKFLSYNYDTHCVNMSLKKPSAIYESYVWYNSIETHGPWYLLLLS